MSSMKIINSFARQPDFMAGREITVYMYQYDYRYANMKFYQNGEKRLMGREFNQSREFWINFARLVDSDLAKNLIRPNGLAKVP